MKIRVFVETNKVGSECEEIVDVDDDLGPNALEETAREVMFNMISWGFERVKDE